MFILMYKKIFTILRSKSFLIWTYETDKRESISHFTVNVGSHIFRLALVRSGRFLCLKSIYMCPTVIGRSDIYVINHISYINII